MIFKLIRFWLAPISKASTKKKIWKWIVRLIGLVRLLWKIFKFFEGDGTE